ncbi:hypothetical protein [Tautonia plasticadhaerens]|uniref:Uncharacterized protein n=1 Tax=Tautonia plasticadhaerens TaxID=2527974 RepID=A0A518HCA4_9BACT|nr:hypothetical protein [Tautonia plasticadhaerens]QDV38467.1 hypothetical protein ElP_64220 [Tautonia plasticadhaerens]
MAPLPIGPGPDRPPAPGDADRLIDELALIPEDEGNPDLLDHPWLDTLPPEALALAVRSALGDLSSPRGLGAIRLVVALADPTLLDTLADALAGQPGLPVDRLWHALEALEGTGRIERSPELFALREELVELIDGDDASLEGLIEQIEEEPEDVWIPLQGLAEIEPEVRAEIVAELGTGGAIGPGTVELLRLLCYSSEPGLRRSALESLESAGPVAPDELGEPDHRLAAWLDLGAHHPDPEVASRARRNLGGRTRTERSLPARRSAPRIVSSLVTGLDGRGRGQIALVAEDQGRSRRVAAAFACDVIEGVFAVVGRIAPIDDPEPAEALLSELRSLPDRDAVEGAHALALGLLAGSLLFCGPGTTPALRYWLERTVGPDFRPKPFAGLADVDGDPPPLPPPFEEMAGRARHVLDACPGWLDDSDLTFELAEELLLRWSGALPDPARDAGAYRFLFEHRLVGQLELYRRLLSWMGWLWRADGALELSRSALAMAEQLSDPQHVVPAHPFTSALSTRSLAAAQAMLRRGVDLRDPSARARVDADGWPS